MVEGYESENSINTFLIEKWHRTGVIMAIKAARNTHCKC